MVSTIIDNRIRTVSAALALVRSIQGSRHASTIHAQKAVVAAGPANEEPLVALLRRYFHASREFLVYGHALALGSAPDFVREPGTRVPTFLIAMPALLGADFPLAMRAFHVAAGLRDFFAATEADWVAAAVGLGGAVARLAIDSVVTQWFPGTVMDIRLMPDLTGLPGQVVATDTGDSKYFACAPSIGKCQWDPAHIGSAVLLEVVRPLVEAAIDPADATHVADQLGLARILVQVRASGQTQSLKQPFLLANPDFRTRLVEIIARALVTVSLGCSLGKTVARAYLNEQESAVGGQAVERVAGNMLRHLRLAPRATISEFLRCNIADLEAPLFARAAGN